MVIVFIYRELVTVVLVKPVSGSKPQIAFAVLNDVMNNSLGEPLLQTQVFKFEGTNLGVALPNPSNDKE